MKIKNLHLFVLLVLLMGGMRVFAQIQQTADVWQVSSTITIDGLANDWSDVPSVAIERPFTGEVPTLESASWKAVWSKDGLYVIVEVSDDVWMPIWVSGEAGWNSDHVELYFDVSNPQQDGNGPASMNHTVEGNYWVAPDMINAQSEALTTDEFSFWPGVTHANTFDGNGEYAREYFIPWSTVTLDGVAINPKVDKIIGFDVTVVDRDELHTNGGTRNRMVWSNDNSEGLGESWNNCDKVGLITFVENTAISGNTSLKTITVNDELISDFNTDVLNYTIFIPGENPSVPLVNATSIAEFATIEITQAQNLTGTETERTATIKVTAQDEITTAIYSILFTSCTTLVIDKGVTIDGTTLTANATEVAYQWVDCNNNFEAIANETNQSFTATVNGNYAVKLTKEGCEYISDCHEITGISVTENQGCLVFDVYPNPAQSQLFINSPKTVEKAEVLVMNVLGDVVLKKEMNATNHLMIDMNTLQSGVYHIRIQTNDSFIVYKIIKN